MTKAENTIRDFLMRDWRSPVCQLVGIDPGVSGAVASFYLDKSLILAVDVVRDFKEPENIVSMVRLIDPPASGPRPSLNCAIERVHAMPRQGVSSMFTFGRAFGMAESVILSREYSLNYYRPQRWQKIIRQFLDLSCNPDDWREVVEEILPDTKKFLKRKKDHNTADAILIALAHSIAEDPDSIWPPQSESQ